MILLYLRLLAYGNPVCMFFLFFLNIFILFPLYRRNTSLLFVLPFPAALCTLRCPVNKRHPPLRFRCNPCLLHKQKMCLLSLIETPIAMGAGSRVPIAFVILRNASARAGIISPSLSRPSWQPAHTGNDN